MPANSSQSILMLVAFSDSPTPSVEHQEEPSPDEETMGECMVFVNSLSCQSNDNLYGKYLVSNSPRFRVLEDKGI